VLGAASTNMNKMFVQDIEIVDHKKRLVEAKSGIF